MPVRPWSPPCALLAVLLLAGLAGCADADRPLTVADLDADEARYVERVVVLERAKAFALTDRAAGNALLDSLATAWGDSALELTAAGIPSEPKRAATVARLLTRILEAEQDSLVQAPRADRLAAPLPEPALPRPAEPE